MSTEQQIEAECCAAVSNGLTKSFYANFLGLIVVAGALWAIAPWQTAIIAIFLRIVSIGFTHVNALRMKDAVESQSDPSRSIKIFLIGVVFGGISWASILYPVSTDNLFTFPGIALIIVMTLGIAMVALMLAPMRIALLIFLLTYVTGIAIYLGLNYAVLGPLPIFVVVLLAMAVLSSAQNLSKLTVEMARTQIENGQLTMKLQEALASAEELSRTDSLTGLANRRAFEEHVLTKMESENTSALLALDLDHFKRINDQEGHAVGDIVCLQQSDICALVYQLPAKR